MIYYVIAIALLALGFLKRKYYCIIATLILLLFAGLRANDVGPDTSMYQFFFNVATKHEWRYLWRDYTLSGTSEMGKMEIGYWMLNFIFSRFTNYDVFKFVCSAIAIIPAGILIYQYSRKPYIAFYIFFTFPIFALLSMTAMRQGCAFGISLIAIIMLLKNKPVWFFIIAAVACLFHQSAICVFVVYVIYRTPYKRIYNTWILVALVAIYALSSALFAILVNYSRIRYESGDAGGDRMLIFFVALLLCSLLVNEVTMKKREFSFLFYLLAYTIALWAIGMNLAAVYRLAAYTEFFICLYVSNTLPQIRSKVLKVPIIIVVLIVSFLVMTTVTMRERDQYGYYPYYFLWER